METQHTRDKLSFLQLILPSQTLLESYAVRDTIGRELAFYAGSSNTQQYASASDRAIGDIIDLVNSGISGREKKRR